MAFHQKPLFKQSYLSGSPWLLLSKIKRMPQNFWKAWLQLSAVAISHTLNTDAEAAMSTNRTEWQSLPTLWPGPAVWTDVGEFMLLALSPDGVPMWEARRRKQEGRTDDGLIVGGTADTFESAKAAALFEATAHSSK